VTTGGAWGKVATNQDAESTA